MMRRKGKGLCENENFKGICGTDCKDISFTCVNIESKIEIPVDLKPPISLMKLYEHDEASILNITNLLNTQRKDKAHKLIAEETTSKVVKLEKELLSSAKADIVLSMMGYSDVGDRPYNEDRYMIQTVNYKGIQYIFAGVFDGHGGAEAATYVSKFVFDKIMMNIRCGMASVQEAIRAAFVGLHQEMFKNELGNWPKHHGVLPSTAGTTASIIVVRGNTLFFANVGDSPIILGVHNANLDVWESVRLSVDHCLDNLNELTGLFGRGGQVIQGRVVWNRPSLRNGVHPIPFLNMTRSIGDYWSQNEITEEFMVSPIPHIGVVELDPSVKCIVICSDGLSNIASDSKIINLFEDLDQYEREVKSILKAKNSFVNVPAELLKRSRQGFQMLTLDNNTAVTIRVKFLNAVTGEKT